LLLRAWQDLLGSRSIETARALSGVLGVLAVPAVWWLARVSGVPRRAAWLACALVAVSPPLVYLGQEARVFALVAALTPGRRAATVEIGRASCRERVERGEGVRRVR